MATMMVESDSQVTESDELCGILGELLESHAAPPAFVGVLSAIPETLHGDDLIRVATAVRDTLARKTQMIAP